MPPYITPLITTFRNFVAREKLFTKEDRLLLACSGGLDSTVLAHLLHAEGYDFAIAHMNFQLRGEASDGDAAFVEELARTLDAKCYCKAVDVKKEARPGESTQMTARRLRYDWFNTLRETGSYRRILTAHHLDDNFETLLLNLVRGTGIVGLSGISPLSGHLARPLLEITRTEINTFALNQSIRWREDASNKSDDYVRNRIRHKLVPLLENEFSLAAKTNKNTLTNLRGASLMHDRYLSAESNKRRKINGDQITIQRDSSRQYAEERDFLWHIIRQYGFTVDQVDQITKSLSGRFFDSDSNRLYVTDEQWLIASPPDASPLQECTIQELPNGISIGESGLIDIDLIPRPPVLDQPGALYLAPSNLPLHLRPRKNGDRFQPLGLGGKTKKVKDYFIDEKVPVWLRNRIYLLTDANDEIMAITGYCISENFKVLPEHDTVLRITTH